MKRTALLAAMAFAATTTFAADKYYLKATELSGTYSQSTDFGFENPARWGLSSTSGDPAASFDATAEYIVRASSLRLVVKDQTNKTFAGGRLVIGEGKSHGALLLYTSSPYVTMFGNSGLKLVRGCILCTYVDGTTHLTAGPIVVDTSAYSDSYAHISFNYNNVTLRHAGTLSVAANKTLVVGGNNGFGGTGRIGGTFEVLGDCAGVEGMVRVVSQPFVQSETLTEDFDNTLALGTTAIPGSVKIGSNCRLKTLDGTNVLEVAELSFATNTWLDVPYNGANHSFGLVRVTDSLSIADTVTITAPALVTRAAKAAILAAPKSSGITEANFVLANSDNDPYRTLSVEEEGDNVVVYVTYANLPIYQLYSSSEMGVKEWWSDGLPAHADANYFLDLSHLTNISTRALIKMPNDGSDYEFPGDSLTLGSDCALAWNYETTTPPIFTCKTLRLLDGAYLDGGSKASIRIKGGKIVAVSGTVGVYAGNGRDVIFESDVSGSANILLAGYLTSSSVPYAKYSLLGDNANFFGRIVVRQRLITPTGDGSARNNYSAKFNTLVVTNACALGGNLEVATSKALVLSRYARLDVNRTTTLAAASNRGIFIEDMGRINVGSAKAGPYTFRVETPLAINGTFWKEGLGTLELTGTMAFGADGTSATPEADGNNFVVTGGVVRVCSADAINGAAVQLSPGTSLELAVDFSDENLTRYGIRNVKTDVPFTLADGVDELPLSLKTDGVSPTHDEFSFALLTVSTNAADAVRGMLPSLDCPFRNYVMTATETLDAETGAVTFGLKFEHRGLSVIVR